MQARLDRSQSSNAKRRMVFAAALSLAFATHVALAEEKDETVHPPGMPMGVDWTFNFDATYGAFAFGNSLYSNPKPDQPSGDLSANWMEGSIKPALSGVHTLKNNSQFYGKLSGVGERTYSNSPDLVGGDASSFDIEDAYVGWRSGTAITGLDENAIDLSVGREQYKIGHGMLLWDGSAEGGSRGGYWTNARKAWQLAGIARFKSRGNTVETFYLEKDELPESNSHNKLTGVNYEYAFADTTLGATYMRWDADNDKAPQRNGLDVYDVRAFTAPFTNLKGLSFDLEYAKEDNGNALDAYAWNAAVAYKFDVGWKPKISYRYAYFEGDNPSTAKNEGFDGLSTGFYDWGAWWQGEIAGEYFLSNSNLISHQIRLHLTPIDSIGTGIIFYDFLFDRPGAVGPGVTSDQAAYEVDWYTDWALNKHFTLSFVAAAAEPNKGVQQLSGRTDTFLYGMIFAAYSF